MRINILLIYLVLNIINCGDINEKSISFDMIKKEIEIADKMYNLNQNCCAIISYNKVIEDIEYLIRRAKNDKIERTYLLYSEETKNKLLIAEIAKTIENENCGKIKYLSDKKSRWKSLHHKFKCNS